MKGLHLSRQTCRPPWPQPGDNLAMDASKDTGRLQRVSILIWRMFMACEGFGLSDTGESG